MHEGDCTSPTASRSRGEAIEVPEEQGVLSELCSESWPERIKSSNIKGNRASAILKRFQCHWCALSMVGCVSAADVENFTKFTVNIYGPFIRSTTKQIAPIYSLSVASKLFTHHCYSPQRFRMLNSHYQNDLLHH